MEHAEQDLLELYSKRILALAAEIPRTGRLENPDVSMMKRSPLCGSTVTVDLCFRNGRVTDFAQDVKACALGQASAAVLGAEIIGASRQEIAKARDALKAMLVNNGPDPEPPFAMLKLLRPARDFKNRHASILLAWDAVLAGIDTL